MAEPRTLKFDHGYNATEFTDMGERGVMVEIDAPWAGSTESGFGQTLSITITETQAQELAAWLRREDY